jgi:hypothetical protein
MLRKALAFGIALLVTSSPLAAQTTLGGFTFANGLFGNTVTSSNNAFVNTNWLNLVNSNTGQTALLTGVNFDTGIANIGLTGSVSYTIGYNSGITNLAGADVGVVVARYSTDAFWVSASTDGVNFGSEVNVETGSAVATGVGRNYIYNGAGPYQAELFVHSLDLSNLGVASNASVRAIRVRGTTELDLIRVAGFSTSTVVPEPSTYALLGAGLLAMGVVSRRKQRQA